MAVVFPHIVEGDGIDRNPEGRGFIGLDWISLEVASHKHRAVQAVAIGELKVQLSAILEEQWSYANFLLNFANGGVEGGFTGFQFTAGAIDLARAEAALFAD